MTRYDNRESDFPQSWNQYAYVSNQPLVNVDPLGLFCPPGEPCAAMDNGAANAAFGLFSESNEFALLSIPVIAQTGYLESGVNSIIDTPGIGNPVSIGLPEFSPVYSVVGSGFDLFDSFQPAQVYAAAPAFTARSGGRLTAAPVIASRRGCGGILAAGAAQTGLDVVSALPVVGEAADTVRIGAMLGSTGLSLAGADGVGASCGLTGISIEALQRNPALLESLAGEIPVAGRIVGALAAGRDIYSTIRSYAACRE